MITSELAALLFIVVLLLLVGALIYLARKQTTHRAPYGSWSDIFIRPKSGLGTILDTNERLQEQLGAMKHWSHKHHNHARNSLGKSRPKEL
ncbi:MAG TPA: hypothetical protein VFB60_20990 [Ktedonobacteraceae bacterium]|nr:hypothetical protein [Ktedonobacteraceae bacterium]